MMILTFMFDGFFIGINVSHVCGSLLVFIIGVSVRSVHIQFRIYNCYLDEFKKRRRVVC